MAAPVVHRAFRPLGRRRLRRLRAAGLDPRFDLALGHLFGAPAPTRAASMAETIEAARQDIDAIGDAFHLALVSQSRSIRWPVRGGQADLSGRELASSISVDARWAMFLHLCAEAWQPETVLELGTCVGVSGSYLASVSSAPRLVTIDGSPDLASIAERTLRRVTSRAQVVVGRFDAVLEPAIEELTIDVAYVDGHHDGEATRAYLQTITPRLSAGALVVLDDIRLYAEMWDAWRRIATGPGFSMAVDVGRFGLLVRDMDARRAAEFTLARHTGWWRVGPPRRVVA